MSQESNGTSYEQLRPLLFSIAYRMLGTVADAEDVVQEAFLRLERTRRAGTRIESPRGFLTTVTTRLAIDELRSARARRESYFGPWLPEPPILSIPSPAEGRSGCLLYGTLAPRKGLDLVARAVSLAPTSLRVVLAGEVEPGFRDSLERDAAAMREAGADIDLRLHRHNEEEGLRLIGGARCVLLPYLNHYTASRVLLEAATAGTPVVAHHRGLLGHLVREHELGLTVDCTDPGALRQAMLELAKPGSTERYLEPLRRFAARYASERFRDAVSIPFAVEGSPRQARVRARATPPEGARMTERKRTA